MGTGKSAPNLDNPTENKDERVNPNTLKTSQKGKDFIKSWEKFRAIDDFYIKSENGKYYIKSKRFISQDWQELKRE